MCRTHLPAWRFAPVPCSVACRLSLRVDVDVRCQSRVARGLEALRRVGSHNDKDQPRGWTDAGRPVLLASCHVYVTSCRVRDLLSSASGPLLLFGIVFQSSQLHQRRYASLMLDEDPAGSPIANAKGPGVAGKDTDSSLQPVGEGSADAQGCARVGPEEAARKTKQGHVMISTFDFPHPPAR
ncbi:hypothetical protein GSI_04806 [Ganoderma sinense ZZ0214-1]|uniref:Uncharacterized protein n=1 Tax=Ganoderma sinense ZZ0214-1 TaxID=1077348 RepID=A0A2G8SHV6_9APHY|nr:hypothetical protein GSI_04806 [Ganoderma sinense ZZ0214-1]